MQIAFRAYDARGRLVTGKRDGASEHDVLAKLRQEGLIPFETGSAGPAPAQGNWLTREIGGNRLQLKERARFARILSALLAAGVPIDRALQLISDPSHGKRIAALSTAAAASIASGETLSAALSVPEARFARHEIGLIRSAEQTGHFAPVLEELARLLDKQIELRGKIVSALVYPMVLVAMSCLSLTVIITVLLPNLLPLLSESNGKLPIMLSLLLAMRNAVANNGWEIAIASALTLALSAAALSSKAGKRQMQNALLRFSLFRRIEAARIFRTLGTLLKNGVPLQSALKSTGETVGTLQTAMQFDDAVERLVGGAKLASALEPVSVVDGQSRQLIAIGEETNRVDELLLYLAGSTEADIARRIERAMTLLTPALTLLLGLLIGGLILSVMRVILSVNELAL